MSQYSNQIIQHEIGYVRDQINQKQSSNPYMATKDLVKNAITDIDHHPYTRFYRGIYYKDTPTVFEREAGWRVKENKCYTPYYEAEKVYPVHCFEAPCSTTFPCYPEYLRKYSDKDALDIMLNRVCINESP